ncbi:translation machinery-associated protein 16 [Rhodotorula toruloides]
MPNNRVKTLKAVQGKKTKVASGQVHPNSRRAKQLQRVELRAKKLEHDAKVRRVAEVHEMDRHLYFVHALPSDATSVSLPDLHQILNDYLNRNEAELVELKHEREGRSWRKGEGKGKRETELEKLREEEESEYKTGFVLPDLTLAENVVICRQWIKPAPAKEGKNTKGGDPSYLGRIRLIRLFKDEPNVVVVAQKGARETWQEGEGEVEMGDADDAA